MPAAPLVQIQQGSAELASPALELAPYDAQVCSDISRVRQRWRPVRSTGLEAARQLVVQVGTAVLAGASV